MARAKVLTVGLDGEVELHGSIGQGKFTDEQLLQVATMPNIRVVKNLSMQPITKLPPFVAVEHLEIGALKQLESLAGLERMVTLRRLEWQGIEQYPDAMERMAELPELVELQINCRNLTKLPRGLHKLPSLISLVLFNGSPNMWGTGSWDHFDYADTCKQIAASKTIRNLELAANVPDVLAPLKRIECLRLSCKKAPPSLWSLSNLRGLSLFSADQSVDLRKFAKLEKLDLAGTKITELDPTPLRSLRSLKLPPNFPGTLPAAFVDQLDELTGPARYEKRSVIPDAETLYYGTGDELPPSFGPVKELQLALSFSKPLEQLANCTQLAKLKLDGECDGLQYVLPHLPKQLRSLEISYQTSLPRLPALPDLTELVLYHCKLDRLDVGGFPKLQRLAIGTEVGTLVGLDSIALPWIEVTDIALDLTKVPTLVKIHVMGKAKVTPPPGKWVTSKLQHGRLLTRA